MTNLGEAVALLNAGDPAGAERIALGLLARDSKLGAAAFVAGVAAQARGQRKIAVERYEQALANGYEDSEILRRLGACHAHLGDFTGAVEALGKAAGHAPDDARIWNNLAVVEIRLGRTDAAAAHCRKALALQPDYPAALNNLGIALQHDGAFSEAESLHRKAAELNPGLADAWANLGVALRGQSRYRDAFDAFTRSIDLQPRNPALWSNRLLCLQYDPDCDPEAVWQAHREFGEVFGVGAGGGPARPPLDLVAGYRCGRPLRVGYVSPDFRSHSVAFFIEPVLAAHDPDAVESYCYADVAAPDRVTGRLQGLAGTWRNVCGMDDAALAEQIRSDRIDILVDLAGHTACNRLGLFAARPAPVQVTWLGYPGTTGLREIDYRLTDVVADPDDSHHSERPVRLPGGFHCYQPPADSPEPERTSDRPPTFGSFNNLSKVTPEVMRSWVALTASVPDARLLLKSRPLSDPAIRESYLAIAAEAGLSADRVELVGHVPGLADHLALYARVDVALDPFPYAGTTTTCEALWMGVPVVTQLGDSHPGRVGASLLTTTGLGELIGESWEETAGVARALVTDEARLDGYRQSLRPRLAASPLCDAEKFTRGLEDALHCMWRATGADG
jgi:predicted O-linked N-acetylglucosamine transferase (SPINDLY family)